MEILADVSSKCRSLEAAFAAVSLQHADALAQCVQDSRDAAKALMDELHARRHARQEQRRDLQSGAAIAGDVGKRQQDSMKVPPGDPSMVKSSNLLRNVNINSARARAEVGLPPQQQAIVESGSSAAVPQTSSIANAGPVKSTVSHASAQLRQQRAGPAMSARQQQPSPSTSSHEDNNGSAGDQASQLASTMAAKRKAQSPIDGVGAQKRVHM